MYGAYEYVGDVKTYGGDGSRPWRPATWEDLCVGLGKSLIWYSGMG